MSSVRPVGLPWRPLKLRLDDDAQTSRPFEPVRIHRQAHRAAGAAPVEASFAEDLVQPFAFGGRGDALRAGHDERPDVAGDVVSGDDARRLAEVGQPAVRARSDEGDVDPCAGDRLPGREAHELQRLGEACAIGRRRLCRARKPGVYAHRLTRIDAPGHRRGDCGAVDAHDVVPGGARIGGHAAPPVARAIEGRRRPA